MRAFLHHLPQPPLLGVNPRSPHIPDKALATTDLQLLPLTRLHHHLDARHDQSAPDDPRSPGTDSPASTVDWFALSSQKETPKILGFPFVPKPPRALHLTQGKLEQTRSQSCLQLLSSVLLILPALATASACLDVPRTFHLHPHLRTSARATPLLGILPAEAAARLHHCLLEGLLPLAQLSTAFHPACHHVLVYAIISCLDKHLEAGSH